MATTIQTIKTRDGRDLHYSFSYEGGVRMQDAATVELYRRIKSEQPDPDQFGVWFAFTNDQFNAGMETAIAAGKMKRGDKVTMLREAALFGTPDNIDAFLAVYEDQDRRVARECDPQEVYFYEYNNHECMYSFDGDDDAFRLVKRIFGPDIAATVKRYRAFDN